MTASRMHTEADMRRASVVDRFLMDLAHVGSVTPNQRWLRENRAAINRAHAEMLAEQGAQA